MSSSKNPDVPLPTEHDDLTDAQCEHLLEECFKPVSEWGDADLAALADEDPDPPDESHKGILRQLAAEILRLRGVAKFHEIAAENQRSLDAMMKHE